MFTKVAAICLYPPHQRRTATIGLVVGTWLTLVNQGNLLWAGRVTASIGLKILLNYLTPFVVANLGLLSAEGESHTKGDRP